MRAVPVAEILDANQVLAALFAFKKGDFSVRLPVNQVGLGRQDRGCLERHLRVQREHGERAPARQHGGRQGGQNRPARLAQRRHGRLELLRGIGQQPDLRSGAALHRNRPRDRSGGAGRSLPKDVAGSGRPSAARRVHPHRPRGQHDGGPAELVRQRSDARGARSRYGRQAGRPGGGDRRRGHVEGSDRLRQFHGVEPDQSGPQHRRSHHRGGSRRSLPQNHGQRSRAKFWN